MTPDDAVREAARAAFEKWAVRGSEIARIVWGSDGQPARIVDDGKGSFTDPLEREWAAWRAALAGVAGGGAVDLIAAERRRQVESEGWSAAHDDEHVEGEMAGAAASYAAAAQRDIAEGPLREGHQRPCGQTWRWSAEWWKPTTPIRNLVKAGALIAAEIDRLLRAKPTPPAPLDEQDHGGPLPAPPVSPVAPVEKAMSDESLLAKVERAIRENVGGLSSDTRAAAVACVAILSPLNRMRLVEPAPPQSQQVAQAAHGKGEAVDPLSGMTLTEMRVALWDARTRLGILDNARVLAERAPPALAGATGASVEEVARVIAQEVREGWMDYPRIARAVLARLGATGEGK